MMPNNIPLVTIFGRTHRYLNEVFEQRLQKAGLTITIIEFALLYRLWTIAEDEITQQNFANMEGKHKSVLMRQLAEIERKRWITRVGDVVDKRKNMVGLTKAGLSILNRALAVEADMTGELLRDVSGSDLDIFRKVSQQLQKNLSI